MVLKLLDGFTCNDAMSCKIVMYKSSIVELAKYIGQFKINILVPSPSRETPK